MPFRPMLASLAEAPLTDSNLVYEPKYDGIRAIVEVAPRGRAVRIWSRLGNEKTGQFPEIAAALAAWARGRRKPVVLDGEIVALDAGGKPTGFQNLQGRIHLTAPVESTPTAFIAFDLLKEGETDYCRRPLVDRRVELERVFSKASPPLLRLSEFVRGDGRALYDRAVAEGWEGLIAKHAGSRYEAGKRSPDWRKLKIVREQEFVVGGWTEPRQARSYFGALLLGVYDDQRRDRRERRKTRRSASSARSAVDSALLYVGHVGTGFNEREMARVMKLLGVRETSACPFRERPKTNERPHWVRPDLVAQVKFTEWTADRKLRHPVYLGLRDDKLAADVRREDEGEEEGEEGGRDTLIAQLQAIEDSKRDGLLELPGMARLKVGNLHKIFWPALKLTKGCLMRYYVQVAPFIMPAVADRPLVMKRYPDGIDGPPFYQHRIDKVPEGVRVAMVPGAEKRPQLVGGDLMTLLYMTQLASISQDPWFSRVGSPESADYVALDLDPPPGAPFARVLDVARWIHEELDALGANGVPKTSGSDGLHVYIPLPPNTPYEAGLLFCQIVATVVSQKHPQHATVERAVRARGKRIYVDYLQNIAGKTLATAYSARASAYAGASTPVTWAEIDAGFDREAFTIQTLPARLAKVGDLWAALRKSKGVDLARVTRYAGGGRRKR